MAQVKDEKAAPESPLGEQIGEAEMEILMENFRKLKERASGGRDGEMRVAVRREPSTGVVEITYVGVADKADLSKLRQLYSKLRQGVRF
jgi:hypothetical protein